jgi:hypothetical protein
MERESDLHRLQSAIEPFQFSRDLVPAAAVDPEPVEKVTRNDSRPAEDLDPVSVVTPPKKSGFYLCRISRHCVWPPPSPLFLMDKSEPKPTPDTIHRRSRKSRKSRKLLEPTVEIFNGEIETMHLQSGYDA